MYGNNRNKLQHTIPLFATIFFVVDHVMDKIPLKQLCECIIYKYKYSTNIPRCGSATVQYLL